MRRYIMDDSFGAKDREKLFGVMSTVHFPTKKQVIRDIDILKHV
jgi:hypothetical protein